MNLYSGSGKKFTVSTESAGKVAPGNTTFFDVEYPAYSNLFDGSYEIGGIRENGEVNTAQTSCIVTGYIPVTGGMWLYPGYRTEKTVNPQESATMVCGCTFAAFYDADKQFVSRVSYVTAAVAIPASAAFTRISWQPSAMDSLQIEDYFAGVVSSDDQIPAWEAYYALGAAKSAYLKRENLGYTDAPAMQGKRWVLFGDSLTASYGGKDWQESTSPVGGDGWQESEERVPWTGYFWATRIAREFGLTLDNRAESGSNINTGSNGAYGDVCGVNKLNAFLAELDAGGQQPDYITVGFGSNSIISQLGTAEDPSETVSSVCGAVKYFIEKLRQKCPNAVIGFVLPPQSDWGSNSTVKSVEQGRVAIKSVLDTQVYAVPYADMWMESGITAEMLPDGIHVSSRQANNLYYHAMRRFMMGL